MELGLRYANGEGITEDHAEAAKWYRKAAEQNYAPGKYNLGICYAWGFGVAKDQVEAVKWLRKAADKMTPRLNTLWVPATPMAPAWRRITWKR